MKRRGWGPDWKRVSDRDIFAGVDRVAHEREYKPPWQKETFRITIMRKSRRLTEWRVVQLSNGPVGVYMEIGYGVTRSIDGALAMAHNAADSAPPMRRKKKEARS